jgi:nicotinate phosphoribosyltransferase
MPQALYTDQYCLTMSQFWWEENLNDTVSFELFVRRLPTTRSYLVVAGLGTALWHLRNFGFTREDFDFLYSMESPEGRPLFKPDFVRFLRELDFTCDVWAIPEGTPVGPQTPILRVTGPRIQATLIESLLLATINHQTMIASKVARIVEAADGRPVWDFSLRRLHGVDASLGVARAAYIAGAAGTATVEAGRILKIPTTGTMAHAMVMAYGEDHEQTVFEKVMQSFPSSHALLVDTYDSYRGVMRAIAAAKHTDIPLRAIRLDSDLPGTAPQAAALLDGAAVGEEGHLFKDTRIIASDDLDEHKIFELVHRERVKIDVFGVGTMLGTSADAPNLGGVYKLVAQYDRPERYVMKLAQGKQTDPGIHQVWRQFDENNYFKVDTLGLSGSDTFPNTMPLLRPVMQDGRVVRPQPTLDESRAFCAQELRRLPGALRNLQLPASWPLVRSEALWKLRAELGDAEAQQEIYRIEQER